MGRQTLTVIDNRTGTSYELPIQEGAISAKELRRIRTGEDDLGLMSYDPGLANTAFARSAVTFIDGDAGVLRYRGYPIEELAEHSTYLETAFLIIFGELPEADELEIWEREIAAHSMVQTNLQNLITTFRYDAHPMSVFISAMASLATLYPDSRDVKNPESRHSQIERILAKAATIAAFTFRHNQGWPLVTPDSGRSFIGNFLSMLFKMHERHYEPHPVLERALDTLFILHADHEQNCGTTAMRTIGSAHADPYTAVAGAAAALYGPLHGAANEEVLRQLDNIGTPDRVRPFLESVKKGECRLM
ncbi:MAG TPA: citrate/2-methylcitrate synthase, partial [Magnetospirillaceae bacterium]|nr:citrate/2-methylcitrate synthase [Magnetospirillaceae bacterium]